MACNTPNKHAMFSAIVFGSLFIAFIVGFSVPYWHDLGSRVHFGLWQRCDDSRCNSWPVTRSLDEFIASQALLCIALILHILSGVSHGIWLGNISPSMTQIAAKSAAAFNLSGGVCGMVGVIIFGAEYHQRFATPNGYGFWLTAACSGCLLLHGAISLCCGCGAADEDKTMTTEEQYQVPNTPVRHEGGQQAMKVQHTYEVYN